MFLTRSWMSASWPSCFWRCWSSSELKSLIRSKAWVRVRISPICAPRYSMNGLRTTVQSTTKANKIAHEPEDMPWMITVDQ